MTTDLAAVVLAGGQGSRLGGVDKPALRWADRSLLERTLDAVPAADPVVVVGPTREVDREVVWTREDPPNGGPLAGLRAGLAAVPAGIPLVAVLAADHPHLTAATLARLTVAVEGAALIAGAVLLEAERPQWLIGVWRTGVLRDQMPADVQDRPIRSLFAPLAPQLVPAIGAEASDVDTPQDWQRLQADTES